LPYMAPEQIEGRATPASDVWALCVSFWELAVGRRPFARDRAQEEVAAILGGARPPLADADRRIDPELAAIVEQGLAAAPDQRPRDGATLALALYRWLGGVLDEPPAAASARILADRRGWESAVATRAARRAAAQAAAATDPFAAMRALDRALAYTPDDPSLLSQISRIAPAPTTAPAPVSVSKGRARLWIPVALLIASLAIGAIVFALRSGPKPKPLDRTDPAAVVNAVIDAAVRGDPTILPSLCLPGEGDSDVRDICDARPGNEKWPAFRMVFSNARVLGARQVGPTTARVGIILPNGDDEQIEMILHEGAWYLAQF
jgi:hypothetical protein